MRFLITSIGSMSAATIIKSLRKNFPECEVIGTDIYKKEWLFLSSKVDEFHQIPKAKESDYLSSIIKIVNNSRIDFILPLTDPEVDVLSENRDQIKGGTVLTLPDDEIVKRCRDKEKFSSLLKNHRQINVIETYKKGKLPDIIDFPIVAKPKKGRSSEGLRYVKSKKELSLLEDEYIIQPLIAGDIITVDVIRDSFQNFDCLARRELIRTSNGAGLSVEVFYDKTIESLTEDISRLLGITGCMNFEFIQNKNDYYLMDINPRFSAGLGFSLLAGYDFVYNHIRTYQNLEIFKKELKNNFIAVKQSADYII